MSEFTVGDLIAVQTDNRPEFNSRVWEVEDIVTPASASDSASASRRLILDSADELLDDDGFLKRISVAEDRCTFLAVVPLETLATQTPSQSSTDQWQLGNLSVPMAFEAQFELVTRFIFGNHGRAGSSGPLLNTWIPLPLLGGNMIMLVENPDPEHELVMYPQLHGYQLHFYSAWGRCVIVLADCDILMACPACQVWPWCAFCHRILFPVESHRASKKHDKCVQWCRWHVGETRRYVTAWLPAGAGF